MKKILFLLLGFVLLMSCEHELPVMPEEETAATGLEYSVDTLSVLEGSAIESNEPSIESNSNTTFSIVVSPFNNSISIDDNGVVSVEETSATGIYNITVIVNNEGGSTSFQDVLILNVIEKVEGISSLEYIENTLSVAEGEAINSGMPVFEQNPIVTFSLLVSPSNDEITINNEGVIMVSSNSESGTFTISVIATNENGVSTFNNILVVNVTEGITSLEYIESTLSVIEGEAISSGVPTFEQNPTVSFSLLVTPSNDEITINNEGVVTVSSNSESGTFSVSVIATNENGATTFNDKLSVEVSSLTPKVTFDLNVLPLMEQKCAPCHTSGSQPIWTDYNTTRALISVLIERVELDPGSPFFMPAGRDPLTEDEINILKNWQSDGLIE